MHCIKSLSFVTLAKLQASVIDLLLLGVAAPYRRLEEGDFVKPFKEFVEVPEIGCERFLCSPRQSGEEQL